MKPTFDDLLKWSTVLLLLPAAWAWLQPERSWPWLLRACQLLLLAINLGRALYWWALYWYRTRKGRGPSGLTRGNTAEK